MGFYNGGVKVTSTEDVIIYRVPTWDSPALYTPYSICRLMVKLQYSCLPRDEILLLCILKYLPKSRLEIETDNPYLLPPLKGLVNSTRGHFTSTRDV